MHGSEALEALQGERLRDTVRRVYDNVPYYAEKMKQAGLAPEDIRTVADLSKLPFTYKTDLRDNYPFGTFAVPLDEVVRVHASSGTTGKQTVVGYTARISTPGRMHGPRLDECRGRQQGRGACGLWLRPVHRWTGPSLWR
jgi:hypothetical protein